MAVSGHLDGGIRFWDLKLGVRTADIGGIHEAAITSVQFNPTDTGQVLTNGLDSKLKIVDIRTGLSLRTFQHPNFTNVHGWSSAVFSPDGMYVAAGSSRTVNDDTNETKRGIVLVWNAMDDAAVIKLTNGSHTAAVTGIDWCNSGSSGQQVVTTDRNGTIVLWA